jgi:hypothetical protein
MAWLRGAASCLSLLAATHCQAAHRAAVLVVREARGFGIAPPHHVADDTDGAAPLELWPDMENQPQAESEHEWLEQTGRKCRQRRELARVARASGPERDGWISVTEPGGNQVHGTSAGNKGRRAPAQLPAPLDSQ